MSKPIYILGHKNPDTDSIVSAIAYSEYKKRCGENTIACRIGGVSSDTEYLLELFGYNEPLRIFSAKCTINEIDYDDAILVSKDITINEALSKILKSETRTLFVSDKTKQLEGVLSLSNLNSIWNASEKELTKLLKTASLKNITKCLKAKVLNKPNNFRINGSLELTPVNETMIHEDDIIVTANKKRFEEAIKANAGMIILVGNFDIYKQYEKEIIKKDITVIKTTLTPFNISRLIYQAPTIEHIMIKADKVVCAYSGETIDECLHRISKSRYRLYPILDENNEVIGALSRYHLVNFEKKKLILVDHNEAKQSIDDIEYGEVLEIVDHHRIGGFKSDNPINISTYVVGATATIIATKFFRNNMKMEKPLAGILLGAILSDTMNFNSPTTTSIDKEVASKLQAIVKVDSEELYKQLILHSESLLNKKSIDILYDDYKEFEINGIKFGISQAVCKNAQEYLSIKDNIKSSLDESCKTKQFALMICMFTLPTGDGSFVIASGDKATIIDEIYPNRINGFVKKLVSRKKQLLPEIIKRLS